MRQLLYKHAPIQSKTVVDRPMIPWYDADLKLLKQTDDGLKKPGEETKIMILYVLFIKLETCIP